MTVGLINPIVSDGLVFYFDEKNRYRSYLGTPVTNLFTVPNNFDNVAWTNSGLAITQLSDGSPSYIDPSGFASQGDQAAYYVAETAVTAQHYIAQSIALTSGVTYTISVYAKAAERTSIWLSLQGQGVSIFNLANGTVSQAGGATCDMKNLGNGWYRCSSTVVSNATSTRLAYVGVNNATSYLGVANNGVYMSRAMLQVGALTQYVGATARTNLTTCYDLISATTATANNVVLAESGITFTGSQYSAIDSTFSTFGNNFTLEAWVNMTPNTRGNMIMGRASPYISIVPPGRIRFASLSLYSAAGYVGLDSIRTISTNEFHHISCTHYYNTDAGQTEMRIYIDGVFDSSYRFNGPFYNLHSTFQLSIGSFFVGAPDLFNFEGKIPNAKVYNRALSIDEVYQNYLAHKKVYQ